MKKITLLILMSLSSLVGFAQLPALESFDNGIPADWAVYDNGVGTAQSWGITNAAANVYSPPNSAEVLRGNIGDGQTSEDWMVTSLQALPANAQFRFFTRSQLTGDNGTLYQIRISSTSQTDMSTFTTIKTYTELELSAVANVYEEKVISLAAYAGTSKYIAFVRVHTQIGTGTTGDKWLVDNVSIVEQCPNPTVLTATNITAHSANLGWTSPANQFDIQYGVSGFELGTGTIVTGVTNPYPATGLTPSTAYQFYVKAYCAGGTTFSEWTGPFNFTTKNLGSVCDDPIVIAALPYQVTADNTGNYGDDTDVAQGTLCGATPAGTNYLEGDEVFYTYTAATTGPISITMTPIGSASTNSSLFVYNNCAGIGTSCIAGVANSGIAPRVLNMTLTAGQSIVIVISSSSTTQTIGYSLMIQNELCVPKPTALTASNFTLTSADLSWTSTYTTAEVAVQTLGSLVPSGSGVPVTGTTYTDNTLSPATQYQYWVRGECSPGSGTFTAWAGPYPFNTQICAPVDQCTYTFRMTDSSNNGWNGAKMEVRQNGIVVATIGPTYTAGAGPVDVTVPLCNGIPFDLYWSVAGTQQQQCIVAVINSFGQTIFTKPAGTSSVGEVVYANTVNCTAPLCNLMPTNVSVTSITTNGAIINWVAPATTSWDIYLVPTLSPPPTPATVPTYAGVTTNPYEVTGLLADTTYDVYVRVVCSPFPSAWSVVKTFTTLPTCPKPTALTVAGITTTSATLGWTNGTSTDNAWEILLVTSPTIVPPAQLPPVNPIGPQYTLIPLTSANVPLPPPYLAEGLTPATIYFYYVRTVCPGDDKSTWSGPKVFNTITCDAADKCNYKFVMTDTGSNGWQGGRMQVLQNGILIQTIGATITGGGPTTITVPLCNNVPFELVWTVAGTAPEEIGLTIQNPFTDIIYTMVPGSITPPTGTPVVPVSVYNSVGNCTPPTCPKPTALLVNAAVSTQTSAELSWTPGGTETQWQLYVVPVVGAVPPVNGAPSPTLDVPPYYLVAGPSPTFTVTNLLPGTAYVYYVRAICSATDVSTWTILNPKVFTTKPVNDECIAAIPVPVNPTQVCTQNVAGNTLGATASSPTITGTDCGNSDDDVWYSFTATNDIHIIDLNTVVGSTNNVILNHTLFSGTCDALVKIYCSSAAQSVATGLTIGQTYYIRVYTKGTGQSASFNICIQTPPPPATNDECATAIVAAVNSNAGCSVTTPGNIIGATGSLPSTTCVGNENDDVWFSFVATSAIHYISLLNVAGTTNDLNHAVYSGACGSLVQKYCSPAGSLTSNYSNYVIGETYYIRIWSNSAASQVVTFDLCIKTVSTCENAEPFCGSSPTDPYIFANTTGVLPGAGHIACLYTTPNPTYYTLHVGQTGPLFFNILQSQGFDADGNPTGATYDVDYVAWGPFTTVESCNEIVYGPCAPIECPNNTTNPDFYPVGNIVDCSYDASYTETLSIPNAVAGEYYILLLTNYSQQPGFIRLVQTNYDETGAGDTVCCDVNLGADQSLCAPFLELNAINGLDPDNVPATFVWYFNGVVIPGVTGSTYTANQSGVYKVTGQCGLNAVEDEMTLILGPTIDTVDSSDYEVCDDVSNDGIASFDLAAVLTPQVLGSLDPTAFAVTYYLTEQAAINGTPTIDTSVPFVNTVPFAQTIYVKIESLILSVCHEIVPIQLVVTPLGNASFTYPSAVYCKDQTNPLPVITGTAGEFSALPAGLSINATTGEINLAASNAGLYTVSNTIAATGGCSAVISTFDVTITTPNTAVFNYGTGLYCKDGGLATPVFATPNDVAGTFTAIPANGLSINSTTGVVDLAASTAGTYEVTNTILATGGCNGDVQTASITITEPITGTISYNSPFCISTPGLQNVTNSAPAGGVYSSGQGLSIDAVTGAINPSQSTAGDYVVEYFIAAAAGCGDFTASTNVTIIPASAISILSGCNGNNYQLTAVQGNNAAFPEGTTYVWTTQGGSFDPVTNEPQTITLTTKSTSYTVTVTTPDGCSNSETFNASDISCTIQKGISPDNDGKNDYFDLSTLNVKHLSIYNRYGVKVYSLANYTNQWYGTTDDGKELPDGTYYYVIERDNVESVTGWIYVIHQNK